MFWYNENIFYSNLLIIFSYMVKYFWDKMLSVSFFYNLYDMFR